MPIKRIRRVVAVLICAAASEAAVAACPICFQVDDGAGAAGIRAALIVLGGVSGIVLGAIGVWTFRFLNRRRQEQP